MERAGSFTEDCRKNNTQSRNNRNKINAGVSEIGWNYVFIYLFNFSKLHAQQIKFRYVLVLSIGKSIDSLYSIIHTLLNTHIVHCEPANIIKRKKHIHIVNG